MTEEEKKTLVDAVNCKYPHQNLTEIYYNIGRALPFTAQRFPDGRVSDWYRNQYVEVVRVEPHGRGGKYGIWHLRNGKRERWRCKIQGLGASHVPVLRHQSQGLLSFLHRHQKTQKP